MHFQIKYQIIDGAQTQVYSADDIFTAVHFVDNLKNENPNLVFQIFAFSPMCDLIIAGNTHKHL